MKKGQGVFVFYPLLFGIFPVVSLYAGNIAHVPVSDVFRPLAISLAASSTIFFLFGLFTKSWHRAGIITALGCFLFFSYGHVYLALQPVTWFGLWWGRADILTAVWAAVFILGGWAFWRVIPVTKDISYILNVVSAAALLLGMARIPVFLIQNARTFRLPAPAAVAPAPSIAPNHNLPKIYYIVLDGYGRSDVVRDLFGVDNSAFIEFLKERGFYVAEDSHANYIQTMLSLNASLNMQPVDAFITLDPKADDREPLRELLDQNLVTRYLKTHGYRTIAIEETNEGYYAPQADVLYTSPKILKPLEEMLLTHSLAVLYLDQHVNDWKRAEAYHIFETIKRTVDEDNGTFIYAHISIPHPPFIFDKDGNPGTFEGNLDGDNFTGGLENYLKGYAGQFLFISDQVEDIIAYILDHSKEPPIIILQSDHGPGAYLQWNSVENTCLKERASILNAYYLPGKTTASLYPSITPTNSFRVILNEYFGEDMPLQPDTIYYSSWDTPYNLIDITHQVDTCTPVVKK